MPGNSNTSKIESAFLPKCLCDVDLPHSAEHVYQIPRLVMPVLNFHDKVTSQTVTKEERIQELMSNLRCARAEDLELNEKFEQRAQHLMQELKSMTIETDECDKFKTEEDMVESGDRLQYQLEHSRFKLAEMRNKLHSLKKDLNIYKKLVRQEVGSDLDLHQILNSKQWKGRAEEIQRIKAEIADMESKAFAQKNLRNPLDTSENYSQFICVEDFIPRRQAEFLKMETIKRNKKKYENEKEISSLIQEYGATGLMYKASVTHNKSLAEGLKYLKDQLELYETKSKEDSELIKKLVSHQMQIKEMLDREAHLSQLVDRKQEDQVGSEAEKGLEATKCKALWEVSEYQKQSLLEIIQLLTKQLENVMEKTEEAEKHCRQNKDIQKNLEDQFEKRKSEVKATTRTKKGKVEKTKTGKKKLLSSQLEAVMEENEFLKSFLNSEIESKKNSLEQYKLIINNIRQKYLEALKALKNEIDDPQPDEIPPQN